MFPDRDRRPRPARPAPEHPQDADLRQGRLPRRRHRPDAREEFGKGNDAVVQDHLQVRPRRQQARGPAPGVPQQLQPPHRRHRRHDRHRHRRQADRVRGLHAHGAVPELLRADEGPRRPGHQPRRTQGGHPRRQGQGPLRARRRRRGHRDQAQRHRPPGTQAHRQLREAPHPDRHGQRGRRRALLRRLPPRPPRRPHHRQPTAKRITDAAGVDLQEMSHRLVDALDPDRHIAAAQAETGIRRPHRRTHRRRPLQDDRRRRRAPHDSPRSANCSPT